jgi:hypothetical protein
LGRSISSLLKDFVISDKRHIKVRNPAQLLRSNKLEKSAIPVWESQTMVVTRRFDSLPKTASGMEFYLIEAAPSPDVDAGAVEGLLRRNVRTGDPVFCLEGQVYVAFPGDVRGAACATRRILIAMQHSQAKAQTRLIPEPSKDTQAAAAHRVISGEVPMVLRPRSER